MISRLSVPLRLAVALAALVLLDRVGVWPGFVNPNELSRFQTATALAYRGTPEISVEMESLARHEDYAAREGKIYSNKAPGLSFLWAPIVRISGIVLGAPVPPNLAAHLWIVRVTTVSLAWLLAIIPFARLVRRLGGDDSVAALTYLGLTFATPAGIYASSGFAHSWSGVLLLVVAERLFDLDPGVEAGMARWAEAGAAAALSAMSEYPTALPAAILFAAAFVRERRLRSPFAALFAGLAVLIPFFLYNAAAFGGPLKISMGFEGDPVFRKVSSQGLFGIQLPTWEATVGLFGSPSRGLFTISPWMLAAFAGMAILLLRRERRGTAIPVFVSALGLFLVIAGFPYWHGGWGAGPRYLVPLLPLVALGLVGCFSSGSGEKRDGRDLGIDLALYFAFGISLVFVTLAAATFPHSPLVITFPPARHLELARAGAWAPTLAHSPVIQLVAAAAAGLMMAASNARGRRLRSLMSLAAGAVFAILLSGTIPAKGGKPPMGSFAPSPPPALSATPSSDANR